MISLLRKKIWLATTVPLKGQNFSTLELIKLGPKWK